MRKENTQKNGRANDLWQEHKRQGRPKQVWVWDVPPGAAGDEGQGHWEKNYEQNNS